MMFSSVLSLPIDASSRPSLVLQLKTSLDIAKMSPASLKDPCLRKWPQWVQVQGHRAVDTSEQVLAQHSSHTISLDTGILLGGRTSSLSLSDEKFI
jgi:hypothetical protein